MFGNLPGRLMTKGIIEVTLRGCAMSWMDSGDFVIVSIWCSLVVFCLCIHYMYFFSNLPGRTKIKGIDEVSSLV